jgi:hypothetical protein
MSYTKDVFIQPIPDIVDSSKNTKNSDFAGKCEAFRTTLFPAPLEAPLVDLNSYYASTNWDWPDLSKIELQNAYTSKIKGKTPGPDNITQEIIT